MAGIKLQPFRCARPDVTFRTDRRKHVVLNRLEIRGYGPARTAAHGDGLSVLVETLPIAGATRCAAKQQQRGPRSVSVDLHDALTMLTSRSKYRVAGFGFRYAAERVNLSPDKANGVFECGAQQGIRRL